MPADFASGFFAHTPAWHRLGNVLDFWPGDWDEARRYADLMWEVEEREVFAQVIRADEPASYVPMAGYKQLVRDDTGATLSVVRQSYGTITVADMGPIIEAVMGQANVRYETTVVLEGGRKVAAVLRLDEPTQVTGDPSPIYPYGGILNSFDGSGACQVLRTSVRIVCANTFAAADAEGKRTGQHYAFRHTANWRDRVAEAHDAVNGIRTDTAAWVALANSLAVMPVTEKGTAKFLAEFVPMPPEGLISDRVAKNVEEARAAIRACLNSDTCAGIGDTAYGLVQAAGEYLDHLRRARSDASRMGRQLLRPEPLKARAIKLARDASEHPDQAARSFRTGALVPA